MERGVGVECTVVLDQCQKKTASSFYYLPLASMYRMRFIPTLPYTTLYFNQINSNALPSSLFHYPTTFAFAPDLAAACRPEWQYHKSASTRSSQ